MKENDRKRVATKIHGKLGAFAKKEVEAGGTIGTQKGEIAWRAIDAVRR